jgi:hypothetical protein
MPVEYINNISIEMHIECASLLLTISNRKYIVINIYRPPSGDLQIFFDCLSSMLTYAATHCESLILCGDLNIDQLSHSINKQLLLDIFESFCILNTLNEPSRVTTSEDLVRTSTAIDYMVTSLPATKFRCHMIHCCISDHYGQLLSCDMDQTRTVTNKQNFRNIRVLF